MTRGRKTVLLFGALGVALAVALGLLADHLRAPRAFRQPVDIAAPGVELATVFVHYLAADSLGLVPLPREITVGGGRRALVGHLVGHLGTPSAGYRAPLPEGTRLLHYFDTAEGGAVIDLSAEIGQLSAASVEEEELRLAALIRTVAGNLPDVSRVRVLVEGHSMDRWGRHVRPPAWMEVDAW